MGDARKDDESQVALDEDGDNLDESQDNSLVHEKEDVEEVDAPPATWKEKIKRAMCACRKRKVYYSRYAYYNPICKTITNSHSKIRYLL